MIGFHGVCNKIGKTRSGNRGKKNDRNDRLMLQEGGGIREGEEVEIRRSSSRVNVLTNNKRGFILVD